MDSAAILCFSVGPPLSRLFFLGYLLILYLTRMYSKRSLKIAQFCHCSGSVTFWFGSWLSDLYHWITAPDPALFFFKMPTKVSFSPNVFSFLFTDDKFTSVFKDNNLMRSHKTVEIKVFLICCLMMMEQSGSRRPINLQIIGIWIRIRNTFWVYYTVHPNRKYFPPPPPRRIVSVMYRKYRGAKLQ